MNKKNLGLIAFFALAVVSAYAGGVALDEKIVTIPTYAPDGYNKNPIFYTGRVYQGAQGKVYPYPLQDVLHDVKADKDYTSLELQNDWLDMTILPEIGGRLYSCNDKKTGFDVFYRQHVIKPALIGMLGAWTSGGVEWNFPHHHRATTFMPVDWTFTDQTDGSKTVWIGETELRHRMKWSIGLSMAKDRAALEATCKFMNRQPYIESMLYWANVSVHCGEHYQVLFPPSCRVGFDHHKNFFTAFPIGARKEGHEMFRSQRSVTADNIAGTMDLSWWKNFTVESRSIFALDPDNDWLAGFDHEKNLGTVHVGNRHVVVGKKFFLWGNFPEARVWDKVLTDKDGPYLELMVGAYSDNQPDYSWIGPYETRVVKQYWYPVKGIGGVKNATLDGCVNLERIAKDKVFLGFHSTLVLKGAKVELSDGKNTFTETIDIDPNTPWTKTFTLTDASVPDQALTGRLIAADGKPIVAYTPVVDIQPPLPPIVENPKPPAEYNSIEELYLTGLRLEQFHNGLVDPLPYYREALKRDPLESRVNLVLGIRLAREAKWGEAEDHLRKAVARATRNYTRAKDAEPHYYLGVVLREQSALLSADKPSRDAKLKEAEDEFWKATWRDTHQREAYTELARIACLKGDWKTARERIEDALNVCQKSAKLHVIHAAILRKLGQKKLARKALAEAIDCDALDYWGVVERAFLEGTGEDALARAEKNRGLKAQQLLECAYDYLGIGATDEVLALVRQAKAKAAAEKAPATTAEQCASYRTPLFDYLAGYVLQLKGDETAAKTFYQTAAAQPTDYCFPSRHEELAILSAAATLRPEDANTWYYLGNIRYSFEQRTAGVEGWEKAIAREPNHALALRNLGFAYGRGDAREKGYAYYLRAIHADSSNAEAILESDKLAEKLGKTAVERLPILKKYRATCEKSDPTMLRMAYLFNETGDYDEALAILTGRRFHVWEGGEGLLTPFVDASLLRGIRYLKAGQTEKALEDLKNATTYPENLQAGRPGDAGMAPKTRYFIAQAYKAAGNMDAYRAELREALKGWVYAGEMNYWRVRVLRELGETKGIAENHDELKKAIVDLEKPLPKVIDAYAKFGGENSPMERAQDRGWQIKYLKALLADLDGHANEAQTLFKEITTQKPSLVWATYFEGVN